MKASAVLDAAEWRLAGPFRGGRVVAVAGDPSDPRRFYFGSTGGGVWRTVNGGIHWANVSDRYFRRASVGALAVASADPNILYAGMGECCLRNNVSHGDGVYRSDDGGRSWRHAGLSPTRHISRIRIHPRNPDIAHVAAFGHAHGPNKERGVYRTTNGGRSWERVLFRNQDTGAIDLAMDASAPQRIYAALWEARRYPWTMSSGGSGSGLFRSEDGGDSWTDISGRPGFPSGLLGRIGVALSPARPERIWALVEALDGGLYRSDDGGDTWELVCAETAIRQRPFYYHHIVAHPKDPDCIWALNTSAWRSRDGGRTFVDVPVPHVDHHDLWIDPGTPERMISGNDGGACVTYDDGLTWSSLDNQPTAELYGVTVDSRQPYWIFGAQQDNTTIGLPSRTTGLAITSTEYEEVGGGESGAIALDPHNPDVVFASSYHGYLTRYDRRSGEMRNAMVWPEPLAGYAAQDARHRFGWHSPVFMSRHHPTLYVGGERVFRSSDGGHSWETISPDLSRQQAGTLGPSGGPITKDNVGAEYYATVFTLAESPLHRGLLWAGTDDGLIHVTEDDGTTWNDVTPPGLPKFCLISCVEPSSHDPYAALVAVTAYKLDDFQPYLLRTSDVGRTWTRIDEMIPRDHFTRVIRQDHEQPSLLFAGTEVGLYVSIDSGTHWSPLRGNLPCVPVHDIQITGTDLVIATHGRSFWVLDDITWLRELSPGVLRRRLHLFTPARSIRYAVNPDLSPLRTVSPVKRFTSGLNYRSSGPRTVTFLRSSAGSDPIPLDAGANPPRGAILRYYLRAAASRPAELQVFAQGSEVTSLQGSGKAGMNTVLWDLRYRGAETILGDPTMASLERGLRGPVVAPGTYAIQLQVDGAEATTTLVVAKDPNTSATDEELAEQTTFLLEIRNKLSETHRCITSLRMIRADLLHWQAHIPPTAARASDLTSELIDVTSSIEAALIQTKARSHQDILNHPIGLNAKLAGLAAFVGQADAPPTAGALEVLNYLFLQVDAQLDKARGLGAALIRLGGLLHEEDVPPLALEA